MIEYGVSGAEKELLRDVRSNGIPAERFREISEERQRLESEYSEKAELAEEEIRREIKALDAKIGKLRQVIEKESCRISEETRLELVKLEAELKEAKKVRPVPGKLMSYLLARVKRYLKGRRHARLRAESQKEADRLLRNEYAALKEGKDRSEYLKNNSGSEIERKLFPLVRQLEALKKIMVSNNYWGAEGELHVIEKLRTLPDEYYLFNDLKLELEEYISFEGKKLKSAQIDHLLVGPSGVYVIETKNWSPAYVKKVFKEHSFTPYDQVKRSSYLVYRYLNGLKYGSRLQRGYFKIANKEIKVQPVIAIAGSKIPLEKSPVQVLFADSLSSHVLSREVTLSKGDVKKIVKQLENLFPM
ncbi:NERD domain-containing protein [Methanosarcina sp. Mfa9]|uniref:nuclease-related domain-containing protein n=1 Tax=Methanosarcina sp. Mfa9 TaxID=3439063 RepID=UPI003F824D58